MSAGCGARVEPGKPKWQGNQAGLDSIPAANIEAIEIINTPSSRYDAAGMAGIVNIVYADASAPRRS